MEEKTKNILKNQFHRTPMDKRTDGFGSPLPPRKPELRKPLLWLDSRSLGQGHELYLINSSDEIIDSVSASSGGFQTIDNDDLATVTGTIYEYQNVEPGDAVKIEEFDCFYDLDYLIQVGIRLKSKKLGNIKILTPSEKGGIRKETVLIWDTGEAGKHVSVNSRRPDLV